MYDSNGARLSTACCFVTFAGLQLPKLHAMQATGGLDPVLIRLQLRQQVGDCPDACRHQEGGATGF